MSAKGLTHGGVRAVGAIADWSIFGVHVIAASSSTSVQNVVNATELEVDWGHPDAPTDDAGVEVFPWDFRRGIEAAAEQLDREMHRRLRGSSATRRGIVEWCSSPTRWVGWAARLSASRDDASR